MSGNKKIKLDEGNLYITIKLQPRSSKDEIIGWQEDGTLKTKASSPPVEGAANKKLVEIIAKKLDIAKSRIKLVQGNKSKEKVLEISDAENSIVEKIETF